MVRLTRAHPTPSHCANSAINASGPAIPTHHLILHCHVTLGIVLPSLGYQQSPLHLFCSTLLLDPTRTSSRDRTSHGMFGSPSFTSKEKIPCLQNKQTLDESPSATTPFAQASGTRGMSLFVEAITPSSVSA